MLTLPQITLTIITAMNPITKASKTIVQTTLPIIQLTVKFISGITSYKNNFLLTLLGKPHCSVDNQHGLNTDLKNSDQNLPVD